MAVVDDVESLARKQSGCLSREQARRAGLSVPQIDWYVASGRWAALFESTYVVDAFAIDTAALPFATRLGAALLDCGPGAVACLETAARLLGLPTPASHEARVQLCLPPGQERHQRPGVELHFRRLRPDSIVERAAPGLPESVRCTSAVQTAADAARTWSEWDSVSLLDAAIATGQLPAGWQDAIAARTSRMRGAVAARDRANLADGRSQSPLETRVRLIAAAAGRPPHDLQYEVRDTRGIVLGYGTWRGTCPTAECSSPSVTAAHGTSRLRRCCATGAGAMTSPPSAASTWSGSRGTTHCGRRTSATCWTST